MTTLEISNRIQTDLDEDTAAPTTGLVAEVLAAINEGQQLIALSTLCLEKSANFTLTAATCWFTPRTSLTDMIVPLRVIVAGVRIRPGTIPDLEAENAAWQATAGDTARYAALGCNLLAVTPQAAAGSTASITYAYSPPALVLDADVPVIPEAYHQDLIEYGYWRVRLKEGGSGLERGVARLNVFLDDVGILAAQVRAKSIARGLDALPPEASSFDRSRLLPKARR